MKTRWTKKCKCGNFIPDDFTKCDWCLLSKYKLESRFDSCDQIGLGPSYIKEEDVIRALRLAESGV